MKMKIEIKKGKIIFCKSINIYIQECNSWCSISMKYIYMRWEWVGRLYIMCCGL